MQIGGHFYGPSSYGLDMSWLGTPDPTEYLLEWPVVYHLMAEARKAGEDHRASDLFCTLFDRILGFESIPDCFLLEISWIWEHGPQENFVVKLSQTPTLFWLPKSPDGSGYQWREAQALYQIPRTPGCWDLTAYLTEEWCHARIREAVETFNDEAKKVQARAEQAEYILRQLI